jgi:hypothetical protein
MARYVKISTIGGPYHHVDKSETYGFMWEQMKEHLRKQIEQVLPDCPDLIVLTEFGDLPAYLPPEIMTPFVDFRGEDNIKFFGDIARVNRCNISFSTLTRGKGDYYLNTTFVLNRDGGIAGVYHKNHITQTENTWNIRYGTETPLIELDFGKVVCAICFDINFEELLTRYRVLKPELIIFSSQFHGGLLQQMWANTCRAFFVGSIAHQRPSSILTPLGETVCCSTDYMNFATGTINLDYAFVHLRDLEQMTKLKKAYGTGVTIYDPCYIGYFMLSSELADVSVADMMREFEIMSYDQYLQQSIDNRNKHGNKTSE